MKRYKLTQIGDTIVEVLICMAVIGFTMAAALGITSRSLARIRLSQERSEALKYNEEQIERLKQVAKTGDFNVIKTSSDPGRPGGVRYIFTDQGGGSADPDGDGVYLFCITDNLKIQTLSRALLNNQSDNTCKLDVNRQYKVGIFYDSNQASNPGNDFYIFADNSSFASTEIVNTKNLTVTTLMYRLD